MENNRNIWVDYLRSSLTVLVVAHHSSLAYTTFASFNANSYIDSTNPIVDTKRWIGLDIFENFNDIFFMSLMFLIGGLFISKSIERKGSLNFIMDRVYRLFIPFLFIGTFLMLVAYFPSFYIAHNSTDPIAYVKDFFTTEHWPVGPPWFIWVLFLFTLLFILINPIIKKSKLKMVSLFHSFQNKPVKAFLFFLLITWLLYVPVAYNIGAGTWTGFGPFDFQLSRILLYFGYFMIGVMIGNSDLNNGIFSTTGLLVKSWKSLVALSLIIYTLLTLNGELNVLKQLVEKNVMTAFTAWMIYYTFYASSCVLSGLAFITVFRKFAVRSKKWWTSLSDNAYLIYLVHYLFVTWTQFLLLSYDIPAFCKFVITFVVAVTFSWSISRLLRRNKLIKQYL